MSSDQDIKAIAEGRQPKPWQQTFDHPVWGPLTFRAQLPNAVKLARHSIEMDNLLAPLEGDARLGTMTLVAAIAGILTLVEAPVVRETRVEDPDDPAHVVVTRILYDPREEIDEEFLATVWSAYSVWRYRFLHPAQQEAIRKSSGETSGVASSDSSSEHSVSPSTIPA